ncbi:MAG: helix-turn-helix transcriptional regulator [Rhizobacter sp.]|nr:helix-turn-helix transcriptional regulator [Ferruginibacter sp.]
MSDIKNTALLQKIALVLKELRNNAELTQEQVYADTNIHIGRLETARLNLSVSTVSALCDYFEISLTEFFKKVEKIK